MENLSIFLFFAPLLSKPKDSTSSARDPGTVRSKRQQSILVYGISSTVFDQVLGELTTGMRVFQAL